MISLNICILLVIIATYFSYKLKFFFNPITGFFLAHSIPIIAFIIIRNTYLNNIFIQYQELSINDVSIHYLVACIFFLIPWLVSSSNKKSKLPRFSSEISNTYYDFTNLIAIFLLINLLISFYILDGVPIFKMLFENFNIQDHLNSLAQLPIGIMALHTGLSMLLITILAIKSVKSKSFIKNYWFPILILLIECIWQGNRQLIMFSIFSYFSIKIGYSSSNNKDLKKLFLAIIIIIIFLLIFILFQHIRLKGEGSSPYEFLAYLTMPQLNYQSMLNAELNVDYSPNFIFNELIPNRFRSDEYSVHINSYLYEPTSPSGYLFNWYLDYGLLGVAFGSLFAGFISKFFFDRRFYSNKYFAYNNLSIYACFTSGIYSHYLSLNNFFIPVIFILVFFSFKK